MKVFVATLLAATAVMATATPLNIHFQRPVLFRVPITLDGVLVQLPVYRGDDFEEVATRFCAGHNVVTDACTSAIQAEMWNIYAAQVADRPVLTTVIVDVGGGITRPLKFRQGGDPVMAAKLFLFQSGLDTSDSNVSALASTIVRKVMALQMPTPPNLPLFNRFVRIAAADRAQAEAATECEFWTPTQYRPEVCRLPAAAETGTTSEFSTPMQYTAETCNAPAPAAPTSETTQDTFTTAFWTPAQYTPEFCAAPAPPAVTSLAAIPTKAVVTFGWYKAAGDMAFTFAPIADEFNVLDAGVAMTPFNVTPVDVFNAGFSHDLLFERSKTEVFFMEPCVEADAPEVPAEAESPAPSCTDVSFEFAAFGACFPEEEAVADATPATSVVTSVVSSIVAHCKQFGAVEQCVMELLPEGVDMPALEADTGYPYMVSVTAVHTDREAVADVVEEDMPAAAEPVFIEAGDTESFCIVDSETCFKEVEVAEEETPVEEVEEAVLEAPMELMLVAATVATPSSTVVSTAADVEQQSPAGFALLFATVIASFAVSYTLLQYIAEIQAADMAREDDVVIVEEEEGAEFVPVAEVLGSLDNLQTLAALNTKKEKPGARRTSMGSTNNRRQSANRRHTVHNVNTGREPVQALTL